MKATNWTRLSSLALLAIFAHLADAHHGRFLSLPLKRRRMTSTDEILKRQIEVAHRLAYDNSSYLVSMDIGTPKQTVELRVDVSSFETWVVNDCRELFFHKDECQKAGTYNESLSDTAVSIHASTKMDNDDGSRYSLKYYADDFTIQGGDTLTNVTFGVYEYPKVEQFGALGLGFGKGVNSDQPNIIDELVSQGAIQTKAFSLALGSHGPEEGSLILGGIDTKKFAGSLQRLPLVDPPEFTFDFNQTQYWINVDEVTINRPDGGDPTTFPGFKVMQHTDVDVSWLPSAVVESIIGDFGITIDKDDYDWYIVPCAARNQTGSLDLHFGDLALSVPYGDLVLQGDFGGSARDQCYISVMPRNATEDGEIYWLGQNIMGHLYTVYDQDGRAVWLARYQDCGSEVVEITGDENAIAGVSGLCWGTSFRVDGSDAEGLGVEGFGVRLSVPAVLWITGMLVWLAVGL